MSEEKKKFVASLKFPFLFIFLVCVIELISYIFDLNFVQLGILPRNTYGLIGILTAPLIHSSLEHLYSNVIPLFVLGSSIFYFYPISSKQVVTIIYFFTNILVWILARESYHIGASGIVYGLFSFLLFSGIFRKDTRAITLSLLTIFLYGGLAYGIFPTKEGISWESHLFGFLIGIFTAYSFRKKDTYKKYDWEDEELDIDVRELKISHKRETEDF
ncbi:MAG: rhomboid family intramembrane serine protease [Bacteroidetes bacterium]|nr:rhomboid family intramembrane serine protease [Bacteroidota bacterium]MBU1114043.1 rhomboid family intramembrane serine protease [Bacteroidota bacterium]MBU1798409.1 rhomboid family intramembrane serine protease [Bacteroidota bacterium]